MISMFPTLPSRRIMNCTSTTRRASGVPKYFSRALTMLFVYAGYGNSSPEKFTFETSAPRPPAALPAVGAGSSGFGVSAGFTGVCVAAGLGFGAVFGTVGRALVGGGFVAGGGG